MPLFEHDCKRCKFIETVDGIDIYTCGEPTVPYGCTLIARFSSNDSDYASQHVDLFKQSIATNSQISGSNRDGSKWQMGFNEYLKSGHVIPYHLAWLKILPSIT